MLRSIKTFLIGLYVCLAFISFSKAANIYLAPETENLISNCANNVDILIDTQGQEIFGASVNMQYDRKNVELLGFYINEAFNLPLDIQQNNEGSVKSSILSLLRGPDFKQTGFTGIVKYATLVIKNKEAIKQTQIDFLFSGQGNTTDNMDVFKLGNAQDILQSVTGGVFNFVDGQCLHQAPDGTNQMDPGYDYKEHMNQNIEAMAKLEKQMMYKQRIQKNIQIISYILMVVLLIVLIIIMYRKGLLENIHLNILKNKKNENA